MLYVPAGYGPAAPGMGSLSSHDAQRVSYVYGASAPGSTAYPAASLALYVPVVLEAPIVAQSVWIESGTLTTSNGCEVGVYDTAGTRLYSQAVTVAVASDTVSVTGLTWPIAAGVYYLAFACDGTRTFVATTLAAVNYLGMGVCEETGLTGATLPSTATLALTTRAYLPVFGLNYRNLAL